MSLSPRVIALLGFGEAGSAIARGLASDSGWRGPSKPGDNAPRRVIAIDPALDKDARGTALGKEARRLEIAISDRYTEALSEADLVISAVQGEHALDAASWAAPLLKKGAHYLDLCTVTGSMADADRAAIEAAGGIYVDVAVMGGFFKSGIKAKMLVAGGVCPANGSRISGREWVITASASPSVNSVPTRRPSRPSRAISMASSSSEFSTS